MGMVKHVQEFPLHYNMEKLGVVYIFAHHYRSAIFQLIDKTWDCEWILGRSINDVKEMDYSLLNCVKNVTRKNLFGPFYRLSGLPKYFRLSKANKFLIFGEINDVSIWYILILNKLRRNPRKIILWSHGWYGTEGFVKKLLKKIFFNLSDSFLVYGTHAKKVAIQQGLSAEKLDIINNSLDYNSQLAIRKDLKETNLYFSHFKNSNPTLIFIGRLTSVKKLDMLIEALDILRNKGHLYNLILVGDGEKKLHLESLVKSKDLDSQVWFYGASYNERENAELIFNADLCVAPGNVGLTAMHSMVYGTPVLSHNNFNFQMPEVDAIHQNITGSFFKYGNISSLAEEILNWFKGPGKDRERIRQNCFSEIDNSWTPQFQLNVLKRHI